jgi:hypothetical protein
MTRYSRRYGIAVLAAVAAMAAMPNTQAYAADSYSGGERTKHRRPAGDTITTGVCIPGEPDFDPEQCHKDITTGAPKPN